MNLSYTTLLLLISFSTLNYVTAQQNYNTNVQYFSVADGLSHREVHVTFKDSRGFIWVGTKYGLNRFGGHHFQVLSKEKDGLADNNIATIFEDSKGWLWVFHVDRKLLSFVNIYTLEVRTPKQYLGIPYDLPTDEYTKVLKGEGDRFLITAKDRIYQYNNGQFSVLYQSKFPVFIHEVKNGHIYGHEILGEDKRRVFERSIDGNLIWQKEVKSTNVKSITVDSKGSVWILGFQLFFKKDEASLSEHEANFIANIKKLETQSTPLSSIYHQSDEILWYKDSQKLIRYDLANHTMLDFNTIAPEIALSYIHDIDFDDKNNIWLSTDQGLYRVKVSKSLFRNYLNQPLEDYTPYTAFSCRGMLKMQEDILVSSNSPNHY